MAENNINHKQKIEVILSNKIKTLIKMITNKDWRFRFLADRGLLGNVPAEKFVKIRYRTEIGKELNLDNPKTYTEKLQWLKLYDHDPKYTTMVDKYEVKKYVAEKIGKEYVIPLLGVWDDVDKIDFDQLPDQFVLKTTHDSGGIVVCKDKESFDIKAAKNKLKHFLRRKYYAYNREWPYKNVKPRVIAEKYMEDTKCQELRDYKFFTFAGVPKILYIAQGRGKKQQTVADFFDMDYNHLDICIDHDMADVLPEKPVNFEKMKVLASELSKGTPQLRVDFYEVDGRVYFGEMTFFHCSGLAPFRPEEWDKIFGSWVVLPEKKYE